MTRTTWMLAAITSVACSGSDGSTQIPMNETDAGTMSSNGMCPGISFAAEDDCTRCMKRDCCDELRACAQGTPCADCIALGDTAQCPQNARDDLTRMGACGIANCDDLCEADVGAGGSMASSGGSDGSGGDPGSGGAGTGGFGGGGALAGTGGMAGVPCEEMDAPDTLDTADDLGTVTDCDDGMVDGALHGALDVDVVSFLGDDAFGCAVNPWARLDPPAVGQICMYADCGPSGTTLTCSSGTAVENAGRQGCCGTGQVELSLNCGGTNDSAQVWIEVSQPSGDACLPYTVEYSY